MESQTHEKKPYRPPQITRVVLRREQAIMAVCSTLTSNIANAGNRGCTAGTTSDCRRDSTRPGKDNAATAS